MPGLRGPDQATLKKGCWALKVRAVPNTHGTGQGGYSLHHARGNLGEGVIGTFGEESAQQASIHGALRTEAAESLHLAWKQRDSKAGHCGKGSRKEPQGRQRRRAVADPRAAWKTRPRWSGCQQRRDRARAAGESCDHHLKVSGEKHRHPWCACSRIKQNTASWGLAVGSHYGEGQRCSKKRPVSQAEATHVRDPH